MRTSGRVAVINCGTPPTRCFQERIERLQDTIRRRGLHAAVLFYSRDILYYTGTAQPAFLVVLPDDYRLFVCRGVEFARRECGLDAERIVAEAHFGEIARRMGLSAARSPIGTELDLLPVNQWREWTRALNECELIDISPAVLAQRSVKQPAEIAAIRRACAAIHHGHEAVLSCLRPGMTELELAAQIENAHRVAGHDGIFFVRMPDFFMSRGPLAAGSNLQQTSGVIYAITGQGLSAAVPAGPSWKVIEEGELVVVDIPVCVDGYHADQARTYAVGRVPERACEIHDALRMIADHIIGVLRPGTSTGDVFDSALRKAAQLGLSEAFLAFQSQPSAHFVGHGIGLEINEPPILRENGKDVVQPGMVLAIELHAMTQDGLTVKLEDLVHVTQTESEILTESPRELTVVDR